MSRCTLAPRHIGWPATPVREPLAAVAILDAMLELRPSCEQCAHELPPDSVEAMICSYECTFCRSCVDEVLSNVCPNCGGGFERRPVRPAHEWRRHATVHHDPPTTKHTEQPVDPDTQRELIARVAHTPPHER